MTGTLRILAATSRNMFVNRFTVVPPAYWAAQILVTSFFSMYFFSSLASYVGNPEATAQYVVIGNAVQSIAATTLLSVTEIPSIEKHSGTLGGLMQTPAPLFTVFFGMSLFSIFTGIVAVSASLSFAAFFFHISFAGCDFASLLAIIAMTCLSLTGMGMLLGGVGLHLRTSAIIANVVAYIGLLICGVNFPVSYLPGWLQTVSHCLPLTYAADAARAAVGGAPLSELLQPMGMMALIGAAAAVAAWFVFRFFERLLRRGGRIDMF
ncbi:MAG: ABC transporter permease [Candidatus Methanoplasma sp.]|jgi:ABC-2 type transport system permease protein|nr:ABC transporter permease [Candidatus Methanoplasma sp.]